MSYCYKRGTEYRGMQSACEEQPDAVSNARGFSTTSAIYCGAKPVLILDTTLRDFDVDNPSDDILINMCNSAQAT